MNIVLWILQLLLASVFLWHGWLYFSPPAELVELMNAQFSQGFRVFIGVAELLGAVGLILPGVTRILPGLTPIAATGLMLVPGSATFYHLSRGEIGTAIFPLILCILAIFVAYIRWKAKPISPRRIA
jgi:uncharacterized membrane protein YphA (DoxX/SURF4 family)